MKRVTLLLLALLPLVASAQVQLSDLRVNHLATPIGVSPEAPVVFS